MALPSANGLFAPGNTIAVRAAQGDGRRDFGVRAAKAATASVDRLLHRRHIPASNTRQARRNPI
ncbi:MAG TPA: hypothetical protein VEH77_16655, partial [Roseiarcus sp.]|nr:hypothetical protein [Roseiarcus sp.]